MLKTVTLSHYTRGKYFGTADPTVAWSVLFNGSPITSELSEVQARDIAHKEYRGLAGPKKLVDWNGDTATETVILEADAEGRQITAPKGAVPEAS